MLTAKHDWMRLFEGETAGDLMRALPDILQARRWFGGKARRIEKVDFLDGIAIPSDSMSILLLIRVEYEQAGTETYTLPVTAAFGDEAERIRAGNSYGRYRSLCAAERGQDGERTVIRCALEP